MSAKYTLTITHLYPGKMNIYGDIGNIITLKRRAEWRGVEVVVRKSEVGDKLKADETDIYFIGGAQDQDQIEAYKDALILKKDAIKKDVANGVVLLAICGGYQMLGRFFLTGDGKKLKALNIIPVETVAPSSLVSQRCIGNIVTEINDKSLQKIGKRNTLVGFENHSGRTRFLSKNLTPLADVISGIGDNEDAKHEGVHYLNTIGSYMHGSFLPKNPHIADFLITTALKRKYKDFEKLESLDDEIEWSAHDSIVKRFGK